MPSYQVTLTNANTSYDLWTLVRAIDSNYKDGGDRIVLQMDPTDTSGANMRIGKETVANLTDSRFGYLMNPGDSFTDEAGGAGFVFLRGWSARCDNASQLLNINIAR